MFFRFLKPLVACSALCLASHVALAQSKVAVISLQKALYDTAEIKKAENDMQNSLVKPKQAEADKLNAQLTAISQKLQNDATLTPQASLELQAEGKKAQLELQRINEDLEAEGQKMRTDVLSKSTDRMQAVVKKLAEEKGVDLVVDTQIALYFKPTMDLTAEATAAYDKAYPVTAAAPAAKK